VAVFHVEHPPAARAARAPRPSTRLGSGAPPALPAGIRRSRSSTRTGSRSGPTPVPLGGSCVPRRPTRPGAPARTPATRARLVPPTGGGLLDDDPSCRSCCGGARPRRAAGRTPRAPAPTDRPSPTRSRRPSPGTAGVPPADRRPAPPSDRPPAGVPARRAAAGTGTSTSMLTGRHPAASAPPPLTRAPVVVARRRLSARNGLRSGCAGPANARAGPRPTRSSRRFPGRTTVHRVRSGAGAPHVSGDSRPQRRRPGRCSRTRPVLAPSVRGGAGWFTIGCGVVGTAQDHERPSSRCGDRQHRGVQRSGEACGSAEESTPDAVRAAGRRRPQTTGALPGVPRGTSVPHPRASGRCST
jgi:hypothetical protein